MHNKIRVAIFSMILSLIILPAWGVKAQENGLLTVSLSRDFGYGGFAGDIEGLFTIKAAGPDSLAKVVF